MAAGLENAQGRGRGEDDGRSERGAKLKKSTALSTESAQKSPIFAEISQFSCQSEIRMGLTAPSCLSVGAESSAFALRRGENKTLLEPKLFASRWGRDLGWQQMEIPPRCCLLHVKPRFRQHPSPEGGSRASLGARGLYPGLAALRPHGTRLCWGIYLEKQRILGRKGEAMGFAHFHSVWS